MKKRLTIIAVIALLAVASLATLAFLTATTPELENTFTVGDLNIELTEQYVQNSKIYPGAVISKAPVATVKAGSEPAYLFVMVDNQLHPHGVLNIIPANWVSVGSSGTKTVYRYSAVVNASAIDQNFTVFTTVTFANTLTKTELSTLTNKKIIIKAYAHQSSSTDVATATSAALTYFLP